MGFLDKAFKKINKVLNPFAGGDSKAKSTPTDPTGAAALADSIKAAGQQQADATRAEGERQAALAKEQAAQQQKQLQDQQFAANMALTDSMNQRQLAAQIQNDTPPPEREAQIELAPTADDTQDPRRKYQSGGAKTGAAAGGPVSIRLS